VQISPDFGSRSSGTNSFLVNGSYQARFEIAGFTNPMIEFHFQPGEVTASNISGAGFEFASLNIHLDSTDEFFNPVGGRTILNTGIQVNVASSNPVLDDSAVSFLKASQSGCMPNGTSCSFTFDSVTTDPVPLGANGFFLFELNTFAAGTANVLIDAETSNFSVARSGDPNGPPGEFGFTISEGATRIPEPSSMMLVLISLAALGFSTSNPTVSPAEGRKRAAARQVRASRPDRQEHRRRLARGISECRGYRALCRRDAARDDRP
jgi:hypothetical protein